MSITDELRKLAKALTHWWYDPVKDEYTYMTGTMPPSIDAIRLDSNIIAIADRIDAEHEREVTMARGEAVTELGHKVVSEYVKLPVDADGVTIHVGDKLTDGEYTFTAYDLAAFGDGSWSIRNEDGNAWAACDVTHHHAPTVEDVLREFTDEVWNRCCEGATASDSGIDELVAECAAKLRLVGEDE